MKIFILILSFIFLAGCGRHYTTKMKGDGVSYEVEESDLETLENVSITKGTSFLLASDYYIYTHKKSKKSYCRSGYSDSAMFVPLDYCLAMKEDVLSRMKNQNPSN